MASVLQEDKPAQQGMDASQQGQQPGGGQGGAYTAGGVPSVGGGAPATIGAGGASKPSSSGQFTNLQKYLQANQGPEGQGLAGQISQNLQGQAENIKSDTSGAAQAFQQQASQNRNVFNQDAVNQAIANPTAAAGNQALVGQIQGMETGTYQGPKGLEDLSGNQNYYQLQSRASNLADMSKLTQTDAGQRSLLSQMFGSPQYTQGQQGFDAMLLQSSPDQARTMAALAGIASPITSGLNQAETAAQQAAQGYTQEALNTQGQVGQAFQGAASSMEGDISSRLTAAQAAKDADRQRIEAALGQGNLSGADLAREGFNNNDMLKQAIGLGIDPTKFFVAGANPSAATIASKDDYARAAALSKLAGHDLGILPGGMADQAGGYNAAQANTFNMDAFKGALAAAQARDKDVPHASSMSPLGQWLGYEPTVSPEAAALEKNMTAVLGFNPYAGGQAPTTTYVRNNMGQITPYQGGQKPPGTDIVNAQGQVVG